MLTVKGFDVCFPDATKLGSSLSSSALRYEIGKKEKHITSRLRKPLAFRTSLKKILHTIGAGKPLVLPDQDKKKKIYIRLEQENL